MQASYYKILGKYRKESKLDINLEACWGEAFTIRDLKATLEHCSRLHPNMQFWGIPVHDNHKQKENKMNNIEKLKEKVFQEALKLEQCTECYQDSCSFNNAVKNYQNAIKPKVPHKAAVYAFCSTTFPMGFTALDHWKNMSEEGRNEAKKAVKAIQLAPEE